MRGLIIREPWIDLILDGRKTWEMRTKDTAVRGRIALIRRGSGTVCGVTDLVGTAPPLDAAGLAANRDQHRIPAEADAEVLRDGWVVPWILQGARRLARPVPYAHPNGAVIWVSLGPEVVAAIEAQLADPAPPATAEAPRPAPSAPRALARPGAMNGPAGHQPQPTRAVAAPPPSGIASPPARLGPGAVEVVLTPGNIRNSHIYLRSARHLLSEDTIGGPNRASLAPQRLTVEFDPGPMVETDIAGDKMILRERAAVACFLADSGAAAGDAVCIERIGPYRLRITRMPRA